MPLNEKLDKTFWVQANGAPDLVEVSEADYVVAERAAGFHNKYGPADKPATGSFSYSGPDGKIQGEIRPVEPFNIAVIEAPKTDIEEQKFKALFVVRWMSHEYEAGWGVTDQEEFFSLHKTLEEAKGRVAEKFKDKQSLFRAGDYFTYPSGLDHQYDIYEVPVVAGHRIFNVIGKNGLDIPRLPKDLKVQTFRQQLIQRMETEETRIHTIDFQVLYPKPMKSVPQYAFPNTQTPQWSNTDLGFLEVKLDKPNPPR